MQLKSFARGVAAAGFLAVSSTALAALPTAPTTNPGAPPDVISSSAPLFVAVWNGTQSIVQYLGISLSQISTTETGSIDFGKLGWGSSAYDSLFSSPGAQFMVFAADGRGGINALAITSSPAAGNWSNEANLGVNGAVNTVIDWRNNVHTAATGCAGANPCASSATTFAGNYFNLPRFGSDLGANLSQSGAGAVGTALDFYLLQDSGAEGDPFGTPTTTKYAGKWTLSTEGSLCYATAGQSCGTTPTVPLPAAGWLLLSGIAGLGAIGRRRKLAAA